MIITNIKTFIKHLLKNKLYSVVTILGFSISLMFVILISVYIKQEISVDQFHDKKDRIYRLVNEDDSNFGSTIGEKIQNALPEIECHTRTFNYKDFFFAPGFSNNKINAELLMADSTFFTMFSFKLLEGTPGEVLKLRNSAVVTQQFARKLFGDVSPVGKQMQSSNGTILMITGIVDEFPQNTQFQKCDAIINFQTQADFWGYPELLTTDSNSLAGIYFLSKPNTNLPAKNTQALELLKKDFWMYKDNRVKTLGFEPITDAYFSSKKGDIKQNSKTLISVLSAIILVILILAIINYINLTIAQSGFRSKEVAVRKLLGSSRQSLLWKYIYESVLLCFFAFAIGILLSFAVEPLFNNLLETNINLIGSIGLVEFFSVVFVILIIGTISGIFPALFITSLNPVDIVKGSFQKKNKSSYSKILVSIQFVATIVLIICSMTIVKQTNYIRNYNLGFTKDNIISIEVGMKGNQKLAFRDILHKIPGVEQVSYVAGSPLDGGNNQSFIYNDEPVSFQEFIVDTAFFSMLNINYIPTGVAWSKNVLWLNEAAIKQLNLEPLPKSFKRYNEELPVFGVMEDFHFNDLHQALSPIMIRPMKDKDYVWSILVKISGKNIPATLEMIKSEFNEFTGGLPFNYQFADTTIDSWYKKEVNTSKIIGYFSMLTILISVMGILALATYYNQLRIKEIGIRKVNGAKVSEILSMLNRDFIKWVAIAFVIAVPIAYFAMNKWLENFAYKTTLSWWIFALAGVLALGIALLTVSFQSWRAATRNPVEALRYE